MHHISEAAAPKEEEEEEEEGDGKMKEGPLWIKLKIPKSSGHRELSQECPFPPNSPLEKGLIKQKDDDDDDDDRVDHDHDHDPQQEEEELKEKEKEERICSVCKKGFSSGKALGGHVRVHVQPHTHKPILVHSKKMKNNAPSSNLILKNPPKQPQQDHHDAHLDPQEEEQGGGGGGRSGNNNKRHMCIVCGKNFKSEKSLFGHMRCHPERPWRGIHPPSHYYSSYHHHQQHPAPDDGPILHPNHHPNKNSSSSTLSSDALLNNPHRHLPQIDLQVIDSAATTTTSAMAIDLSGALRGVGWSKTDRRGRKQQQQQLISPVPYHPCRSVSASCGWEFEEEEQDAAHELMCLSHHPHSNQFLHHQEEEEAAAAAAAAEASSNSLTDEAVVKMETNNGSKKSVIEDDVRDHDHQQLEQIDDDDGGSDKSKNKKVKENKNMKKRKRKRRRQMKIRDLGTVVIRDGGIGANIINPPPTGIAADGDDEALLPDRFKCSTCNKTFPTHQALGGHRSSHNKLLLKHTASFSTIPHQHQPSTEVEEEEEERESGPPLLDEQEDNNDVKKKKTRTMNQNHHEDDQCETGEDSQYNYWESAQHLCRICSKSFTTGQALGGHMRRHYYLPAETATTANTWTRTGLSPTRDHGGDDDGGGKGVLNFDLNELPPAFEEEEGGGMSMAWKTGGSVCE